MIQTTCKLDAQRSCHILKLRQALTKHKTPIFLICFCSCFVAFLALMIRIRFSSVSLYDTERRLPSADLTVLVRCPIVLHHLCA